MWRYSLKALCALNVAQSMIRNGIGEVPRRIIAKAVLHLVDLDVREACGALQVCAGCEGGCEAAVHAVRRLFHDPGSQAFSRCFKRI